MRSILKTVLTLLVLPAIIVVLAIMLINSIKEPVDFKKAMDAREVVAIQRLKDIRTLEVAFKSVNNRYTADIDSLKNFYHEGDMEVVMQIGSQDDSAAVANTKKLRRKYRKITDEQLYERHLKGERLVFSIVNKIPVRDTLFNNRADFDIDSLGTIPFSGGQPVQMDAVIKKVSGVDVPLFEAKMPFKALLRGLDNQLRINIDAERKDQNRYPGLQVGSVTAPNNNAGNWE